MSKSKSSPTALLYGASNRKRLLEGVSVFARAVCTTYGPQGKVVMLDRAAGLMATKDGVTVAREVDLEDPVANLACRTLREACIRVNNEVGDGTTSVACIAASIMREGCKEVEAGLNPVLLARSIMAASKVALDAVWDMSQALDSQEDLTHVALLASNGDLEVASRLAEAVMAVGKNGTVSIEDGHGVETILTYKEGMEIDRGAAHSHFLRNMNERKLDGPLVAVVAATLRTAADVLDICECATMFNGRPMILFCLGIEGDALKTMLMNDANPDLSFEFVPVLSPGNFDKKIDYLEDIAALADATLIDPARGGDWKVWDQEWFGAFRSAVVETKKTTLVAYDEASESIRNRVKEVKASKSLTSSQFDIDRINERLAILEGGFCVMQIGGHTEAELKEKRARVEDALGAVQAALKDGIVPGGGTAYLAASQKIGQVRPQDGTQEEVSGWRILQRALLSPLKTLAINGHRNGDYLIAQILDLRGDDTLSWIGWNALTNKVGDLSEEMVVLDPCKVVCAVIEAAVSAASTLLTSEVSITRGEN